MTTLSTDSPKVSRVASVDVYRGMVMFLMLAEILHLSNLKKIAAEGSWFDTVADWLAFHTTHVPWRGGSLHDMIQPSFSFLVGTAIAFSLVARGSKGQTWARMFGHAIFRSVALVFLGIFLRSLGKPITNFTFDDTLTQIGLGYWLLFLLSGLKLRGLIVSIGVILFGYWLAFVAYPAPGADFPYVENGVPANWTEHYEGIASHFNKNSNLAWRVDQWWMNQFPREKPYLFSGGGYCSLSFIPTLATMLLGLIAGRLLQWEASVGRKQLWLWAAAVLCISFALVIDAAGLCPIVKRIWTPTWALYSGGLCFVWIAFLNAICDIAGYKNWGFPFVVIGANSIAAYVMSWTIKEQISLAIMRHFGYFVDAGSVFLAERFELGDSGAIKGLVIGVLTLSVIWLSLLWMYRKRIFLKI
jgi:heparan-alpha-glucosaminide N-acetyltransferase